MYKVIILAMTVCTWSGFAKKYQYGYQDRDHTLKEDLTHIAALYPVSWVAYYLSQPAEFRVNGSFSKFEDNFGKIVYDNDEPFWNWIVHPYSGSQLFLYYRANGYSQIDAFKMTLIQSTVFEFLVETYTEPASAQDLYQTPLFGSLFGLMFEKSSLYLLNSEYMGLRILGHIINPASLFWFFEGKVIITPELNPKKELAGMRVIWQF